MLESKSPIKPKTTLKAKTALKAKSTIKKSPKHSVSKLKKEADRVFSIYVRLRDDKVCITCGGVGNQAGHFMSRRYNSTRYEEENVNAQCYRCNVAFNGEQYKYAQEVDLKYGHGTARKLQRLAQQPHPFTVQELQQIIADANEAIAWYKNKT